jgi:unsaturated rhamnogalacturonyl hydrolase
MDIDNKYKSVLRFALEHVNERDCWIKAPAITAALECGDEKDVAVANTWLARAVAMQRSDGNLSYADTIQGVTSGHVRSFTPLASLTSALGYPLLLSCQRAPNEAFMAAASRQVESLRRAPRTSDGGIWARGEGPELWIDFIYMMAPFLALYGQMNGDSSATDEAFHQYEVHIAHLLDARKNLARHAWCERPDHFPQSTFWNRGNGWLICAGVDLLSIAPDHAKADAVRRTTKAVIEAMSAYQESSGYFCHVLDDPRSNLEASGTVMYAYATARAITLGVVSQDMLQSAQRALDAVASAVEPSGKVPGVSVPPGGPGVPFDWTLFGQGFFVLATKALRELNGKSK